jgi:hypothetical protein
MINYNWITDRLYTVDLPTESNYVVNAYYSVIGTDDTTNPPTTAELTNNIASFTLIEDDPNYIPYDELTNDIIISWIQNQLGPNGVLSIESAIAGMIDIQINPPQTPTEQPLPFN